MAGIQNLTEEILREAREAADRTLSQAKEKAAGIEAEARREAEKLSADGAARSGQDAEAYGRRIDSQIGMRRRQVILGARQKMIEEVITAAEKKLENLPDADYFDMLLKLLASHASGREGTLLLSEKDLARLPADFAARAEKTAEEAGGKVKVSDEAAPIGSGFLLRCGGIDENCTLKALFAEKRDELQDRVREVLW